MATAAWNPTVTRSDTGRFWNTPNPTCQGREDKAQKRKSFGNRKLERTCPDDVCLSLDFLYPTGLLLPLRRSSQFKGNKCHSKASRYGPVRDTGRPYTSVSHQVSEDKASEDEPNEFVFPAVSPASSTPDPQPSPPEPDQINSTQKAFHNLKESPGPRDYDRAWRLYQADAGIPEMEIMDYLSTSTRPEDMERIVTLFEASPQPNRTESAYRQAIGVLLRSGNVEKAVHLHTEALGKQFARSFGSDILFAKLLEQKNWQLAFQVWQTYRRTFPTAPLSNLLWTEFRDHPNSLDLAFSLSTHEKYSHTAPEGDYRRQQPDEFKMFVSGVIIRAVLRCRDEKQGLKIVPELFQRLKNMKEDKQQYYEKALRNFFENDMNKLALEVWDLYRVSSLIRVPSIKLLQLVLDRAIELGRVDVMREIVRQWSIWFKGPDATTYIKIMYYFGRTGDIKAVETLLQQFQEAFAHRRISPGIVQPLLQAYATRGQSEQALKLFNELGDRFGITDPTLNLWNLLLNAYNKADDFNGAETTLRNLRSSGLRGDNYTYGTVIMMCARRGDIESVEELLGMADDEGVEITAGMYDGLILAYVQNDQVDDAELLAEKAFSMRLSGSLTRMWNYVLHARASRRQYSEAMRVYNRMKEANLHLDHLTYASLLQAMVTIGEIPAAYKVLRKILPQEGIKATSLHYAIIMGGFLRTGNYMKIFKVYEDMTRAKIRSTLSTRVALIKASVVADEEHLDQQDTSDTLDEVAEPEAWMTLTGAERILQETLVKDISEIIGPDPMKFVDRMPISKAYPAALFEYIIFAYGHRKAFDKVRQMFNAYVYTAQQQRRDDVVPPIKILTALMTSAYHEGDHEAVRDYWHLAYQQAAEKSRRWNSSDTTKEGWVLPSRRYVLSSGFSRYIKSLSDQGKFSEMKDVADEMLFDGYRLDKTNINLYVQLLLRHGEYTVAFKFAEQYLMPGWGGWRLDRWRAGLPRHRVGPSHGPGPIRPTYHTLMFLARAVIDMRMLEITGRKEQGTLMRISELCPRTMQAVSTMPYSVKELQREIMDKPLFKDQKAMFR